MLGTKELADKLMAVSLRAKAINTADKCKRGMLESEAWFLENPKGWSGIYEELFKR